MATRVRSPLPDQADREQAIRCFDRPVVVEAAAGTGKTTLLVDRVVAALLDDPRCPTLHEIVAITFTEKAAAEMKERLRDRLEELLRAPPDQPPARRSRPLTAEQRQRVEQAIRDLETAPISTIHAFCMNILRERPVEAGLDPDVRVADPAEQEMLFDEAWRKWFERVLAHDGPPDEHAVGLGLSVVAGGSGVLTSAARMLRGAARRLVDNRDVLGPDRLTQPPPLAQRLADLVREHAADLQRMAQGRHSKMTQFAQALQSLAQHAQQLDEETLRTALAQACPTSKFWPSSKPSPNTLARYESANRVRARLLEVLYADRMHALLQELFSLVQLYERLKEQRKLLDFLDLLLKVRDLFTQHPHVCAYFARQYKHILIDEFQDTDPIQVRVAHALVAALEACGDGPTLFVVGDPKQSIYRFRRADIETYEAAIEQFCAASGQKLFLRCNFRSVPCLLNFVNWVFEPIIRVPNDGGRYQPAYVALEPAPGKRDTEHSGIYVLPPPESIADARVYASELRRLEGYVIGRFIHEAVAQGWRKHRPDGEPLRYGDVAILLERTTELEQYELGFQAAGLPYRILGAKQFYQRIELKTVLNVLRALERPAVALHVLAAVRSPLFGISDEDLAQHRLKGYPFDFLHCRASDTPLARPFELLRGLYRDRNRLPVHRLLERLLEETSAVEFFAALPRGVDRAMALMHLCEEAQRLANAGMTFRGFVRWLEERVAATEEETELPDLESDEGTVSILTIHSAKGLEFPMVVLAGLSSRRDPRPEAPLVDRLKGRTHFAVGSQLRTMGWAEAEAWERRRLEAERIRLFYVACTRPRDFLVLPIGWPYKGPGQPMERYLPDELVEAARQRQEVPDMPYVRIWDTDQWAEPERVPRKPSVRPADLRRDEVRDGAERIRAVAARFQQRAHEAAQRTRTGWTVVRPSSLARPAASAKHRAIPVSDRDGRAIGSLVHRALRVAIGQGTYGTPIPEWLEGRIRQWAALDGVNDQAEEVLNLVRNVLGNRTLSEWLRTGTAHTEVPVVASIQVVRGVQQADANGPADEQLLLPFEPLDGDPRTGFIEGVADLVIDRPDGTVVLVDFKTDPVEHGQEHELVDCYREQIGCYVKALRQALPGRMIEAYLAVAATGQLVPVPVK